MTAPHPEPAVATHTVRVFNLRLWLPLSLIIASAVMALILVADQQRHYAQHLQRFADHTAHAELLETQRALETVLRRSDGSGTVGIVSQLGLNPAIAHAPWWAQTAKSLPPPALPGRAAPRRNTYPATPKTPCGRFAGRSVSS